MKIIPKKNNQRDCIPIKLFEFPSNSSKEISPVCGQNMINKFNHFFSRESSLKNTRPVSTGNSMSRSQTQKSLNEKLNASHLNGYSFINLNLDQMNFRKSISFNNALRKEPKVTKKSNYKSPMFLEDFFKNSGIFTPNPLVKKSLSLLKHQKTFQNPTKEWIVFDSVCVMKPITKVIITSSAKKLKFKEKPKKKIQARIPQPAAYSKTNPE
jgi:hypothetical protein